MNKSMSHAAAEATQQPAMTYEQWIEAYKPIKNHFNELAPLDGTMFETFDQELLHVKKADDDKIWTLVEGDENEWILVNGFHYVNRIGYVITEVPFVARPDMQTLDIVVDDGENPDYPKADWQHEVANGYTKLGYLEWVFHKEESEVPDIQARSGQEIEPVRAGGAA